MKHIVFEYRDQYTNGGWSRQECVMSSLAECIQFYGLGLDCEYRIISVEDVKAVTDWLDEVVTCKYCGNKTTEGEKIWLNGKCMCPTFYMKERAKEDAMRGSNNE